MARRLLRFTLKLSALAGICGCRLNAAKTNAHEWIPDVRLVWTQEVRACQPLERPELTIRKPGFAIVAKQEWFISMYENDHLGIGAALEGLAVLFLEDRCDSLEEACPVPTSVDHPVVFGGGFAAGPRLLAKGNGFLRDE